MKSQIHKIKNYQQFWEFQENNDSYTGHINEWNMIEVGSIIYVNMWNRLLVRNFTFQLFHIFVFFYVSWQTRETDILKKQKTFSSLQPWEMVSRHKSFKKYLCGVEICSNKTTFHEFSIKACDFCTSMASLWLSFAYVCRQSCHGSPW